MSEDRYVVRYRRPGDRERVRRTEGGRKRAFTYEEAEAFIERNSAVYPNARIVRLKRAKKNQ